MPDGVGACYPEDSQATATTGTSGCGILVEAVSSGIVPRIVQGAARGRPQRLFGAILGGRTAGGATLDASSAS